MPYPNANDDFRPFTSPIFRALELRDFAEEVKFKREARNQQRQQWQMELEDRQRNNQLSDFHTLLLLHGLHAQPAEPGATPSNDAALRGAASIAPENSRQLIQTPRGQYRLPSQTDDAGYANAAAQRAGAAEGIKESTKRGVEDSADRSSGRLLQVTYPAFGDQPEVQGWVPRDKYVEHMKTIRDLKAGKFSAHEFKTDKQTGQTTFFGVDSDTGKQIELPFQTKMKPDTGKPKVKTQADYEAEVDSDFHPERERRIDEMMPWAFSRLGIDPHTKNSTKIRAARNVAAANVDNSIKDERRTRIAQRRQADRGGATAGAAGAPGAAAPAAPAAGLTVRASELPAKLDQWNQSHPNRRFDMNSLRNEFKRRGYSVVENQ
jgi:hypothetical protein